MLALARGPWLHRVVAQIESNGHIPDWPMRTERLTLRPHREDDLGWLQEMYAQPEVVRHLLDEPWDEPTARQKLVRRIEWNDLAGPSGAVSLVVEHAGVPVGEVMLWLTNASGRRGDRLGPGSAARRPGFARERGGDAGSCSRSMAASGGGAD
ncbi:GNAT family N-acetyltransferase, partial [Corynebacterium diphtheriae]